MTNLTKTEQQAYEQYVHTPTQAQQALYQLAQEIYGTTGISTGSAVLDHYMIPTRQNWVRLWVGASGHGKSTMLRAIAMNAAKKLQKEGAKDLYVAHITYEEAVDAQEIYYEKGDFTAEDFWRGKVEPSKVLQAGMNRAALPIYWLGESMMKSSVDSVPMTIDLCMAGLRAIWKIEGKLPAVIMLDYVQEIHVEGQGKRTELVFQAMQKVVSMGIRTKCAIELAVQANQVSLDRNPPIPTARDIEYSHKIFQKATNAVATWRPWMTHKDNQDAMENGIPLKGPDGENHMYPLSPNLTVCRPLKHRPGLLRMSVPIEIHPSTLEITDLMTIPRR